MVSFWPTASVGARGCRTTRGRRKTGVSRGRSEAELARRAREACAKTRVGFGLERAVLPWRFAEPAGSPVLISGPFGELRRFPMPSASEEVVQAARLDRGFRGLPVVQRARKPAKRRNQANAGPRRTRKVPDGHGNSPLPSNSTPEGQSSTFAFRRWLPGLPLLSVQYAVGTFSAYRSLTCSNLAELPAIGVSNRNPAFSVRKRPRRHPGRHKGDQGPVAGACPRWSGPTRVVIPEAKSLQYRANSSKRTFLSGFPRQGDAARASAVPRRQLSIVHKCEIGQSSSIAGIGAGQGLMFWRAETGWSFCQRQRPWLKRYPWHFLAQAGTQHLRLLFLLNAFGHQIQLKRQWPGRSSSRRRLCRSGRSASCDDEGEVVDLERLDRELGPDYANADE